MPLLSEDLTLGTGAEVLPGAAVVAHYVGTLKSTGAQFDSSIDRGEPAVFPLSGVIKGWQQGVPGMKVGGKRRLTIPAELAYGSREIKSGGRVVIPASSELVFEIEIVSVLESTDTKIGTGALARADSTVTCHYTGTLKSNGKKFDSSIGGDPISFGLDQVIQGWQFGIPGMKVGGKRRLVIPWQMAYGEDGAPPDIPARADLVFEVELTDVE